MEYTGTMLLKKLAGLNDAYIQIPEGIPDEVAYIRHADNWYRGFYSDEIILFSQRDGVARLQAFCKKHNVPVYG